MVFALSSAALVYQDFKPNDNGTYEVYVTDQEAGLAAAAVVWTALIMIVSRFQRLLFSAETMRKTDLANENPYWVIIGAVFQGTSLLCIVFCCFVIDTYSRSALITATMGTMSLVVLILWPLACAGLCVQTALM